MLNGNEIKTLASIRNNTLKSYNDLEYEEAMSLNENLKNLRDLSMIDALDSKSTQGLVLYERIKLTRRGKEYLATLDA